MCSQVSAQEVLIPYRKGKLWGLADTFGKIKVEPQFDAEPFKVKGENNLYYVDVARRKGIYNAQNLSYTIPCNYLKIEFVEQDFFLAKKHSTMWNYKIVEQGDIYTFKGEKLP